MPCANPGTQRSENVIIIFHDKCPFLILNLILLSFNDMRRYFYQYTIYVHCIAKQIANFPQTTNSSDVRELVLRFRLH